MRAWLECRRAYARARAGEFIPIAPNMAIVFETTDLVHASPAIASRCGTYHAAQRTP
jgi:hypothetical protein